eukprot:523718-Pleurochrysis_carterae.AAC.1
MVKAGCACFNFKSLFRASFPTLFCHASTATFTCVVNRGFVIRMPRMASRQALLAVMGSGVNHWTSA